jgi:heme/copper-type cytochrome/quinol oxidase subunit 4
MVVSPALAFAHNHVANPYLHAAMDVLTLAVVTAPLWTAYLWGGQRRGLLIALVALVQLPVAVLAFMHIPHQGWHAAALLTGLGLTVGSLWAVRRATRPARSVEPASR